MITDKPQTGEKVEDWAARTPMKTWTIRKKIGLVLMYLM